MSRDRRHATDYLLGVSSPWPDAMRWKWSDNGRVVLWADGSTVAFREEVLAVLTRLSPLGLPPFGAVLVLIAMTRNTAPTGTLQLLCKTGGLFQQQRLDGQDPLARLLQGFERVRALPPELRVPLRAKERLAELVFDGFNARTIPSVTERVLALLRGGAEMEVDATVLDTLASDPTPEENLQHHLCSLLPGLERVDAERLGLRRSTGLEELPKPADVDLPPGERVRGLLKELEDDPELGGLARLTRELMAALTLPRAVSEPEELPQGGVSDLTNRGPLDRLLLSELAHDDLTLAVRVATGAALYWRRERPPQPLPRTRSLLLEAGIRSWGVPRVFATAVALAAAATVDRHTQLNCQRASQGRLLPVDLLSRAGLIAHLEALDPDAHPGAALSAFAQGIAASELETDAVLILGADVYADAEFLRLLAESNLSPLLVATVDRAGAFTLLARSERGMRVLREAKLDLQSLFSPPRPREKSLLQSGPQDRPAIFRVKPFPLRLSHQLDSKRVGRIEGVGILTLTRDRRLMLWDRKGCGARQLAAEAIRGKVLWCSPTPLAEKLYAIVGSLDGQLTVLEISPDSEEVNARPLPVASRRCVAVTVRSSTVFAISRQVVESFQLLSGDPCGGVRLAPGLRWYGDHFFVGRGGKWFTLAATATGAELLHFYTDSDTLPLGCRISRFINHPSGLYGLRDDGDLVEPASGGLKTIDHQFDPRTVTCVAASRRGEHLILRGRPRGTSYNILKRVCLTTGEVVNVQGDPVLLAERVWDYVTESTLRTRFRAVGSNPRTNELILVGSRRKFALRYDHATGLLILDPLDQDIPHDLLAFPFQRLPSEGKYGFRLNCATWSDGSKVFLDSRGLLHLQSGNRKIPEVTLVLRDGPLAGWCADGTLFGPKYFTGVEQDLVSILHVWNTAIQPFVRGLT